jgi:hypothetical protein
MSGFSFRACVVMALAVTSKNFAIALVLMLALPSFARADTARFTFILGGKNVGHLTADTQGDQTSIDYEVKNNGRGPTMTETIKLDGDGLPTAWTITGTTTFGSKVAEHFIRKGSHAKGSVHGPVFDFLVSDVHAAKRAYSMARAEDCDS